MNVIGNGIATIVYGIGYYHIIECKNKRDRLKVSVAVAIIEFIYKIFLVYIAKENALNAYRVVFYLFHWILYLGVFALYLENAYYQFIKCYLCMMAGAAFSSGLLFPLVRAVSGENSKMLALSQVNTPEEVVTFGFCAAVFTGAAVVFAKIKFIWKHLLKKSEALFYSCLFFECVVSVFLLEAKDISGVIGFLATFIIAFAVIRNALLSKEKMQYMEMNNNLRAELQKQYSYYWKMSNIQEKIRKVRHDLSNHLQIIEGAGECERKEAAEKYRAELLGLLHEADMLEGDNKDETVVPKKADSISKYGIRGISFCVFATFICVILLKPEKFVIIMKAALVVALISIFLVQAFSNYKMRKEKHEKQRIERKIKESENVSKEWKNLITEIENISCSRKLMETIMRSKVCEYTGNLIVDIMLQKKCEYCRMQNIETKISLSVPEEEVIKNIDIIGILGNAFDNAIEACMRAENVQKEIEIYSEYVANFWMIRIGNTKNHKENPVKKQFRTRKKDKKSHGIGMKIIKETVKKYDGEITVYDEGTEFIMLIMLKIK